MRPPGPILLYSIYESDLARFERLLAQALPAIPIRCAISPEQAAPHLAQAAILYGWGFPPAMLRKMPKLRWVQKMGAGVDELIEGWPFGSGVLLTRTDGKLIAPRMAEYVLAAILDKSMRLDVARRQQQERRWSFFEIGTIRHLTIGIAGVGEIGSFIARMLRSLGARVIGWRRSREPSSAVNQLFVGDGELPPFLGSCDVVVLVLPLTKATRTMFTAARFASCRQGTHIINIGRGAVIDEQALLGAISAKIVAHATLDVFASEPLPHEHPFWQNPNITITPHICGPLVPEDVVPHFLANYAAFASGRALSNVIDLDRQY
jgi:glyoxylate/hydroxypyruvate reductase A